MALAPLDTDNLFHRVYNHAGADAAFPTYDDIGDQVMYSNSYMVNSPISSTRRLVASAPNYAQTNFNGNYTTENLLKFNKDELLKSRARQRDQFTVVLIQAIIEKYNAGFSEFRIRFNKTNQTNSFKADIGYDYLEHAINHLQSKDFMCVIEDLANNNLFDQEYIIYL